MLAALWGATSTDKRRLCSTLNVRPFLGGVRDEGLKNFLTVVTFRVFSLVFFSSNLEKGPREACPGCGCGAVDWEWDWVCAPWLLAYAASSSRCSLVPRTFDRANTINQYSWSTGWSRIAGNTYFKEENLASLHLNNILYCNILQGQFEFSQPRKWRCW